jgi:hypothetical protein
VLLLSDSSPYRRTTSDQSATSARFETASDSLVSAPSVVPIASGDFLEGSMSAAPCCFRFKRLVVWCYMHFLNVLQA